ncbi:MAG: hypothetical protein ACU837_11880 [Gammaproteobacteria bacterium]
MKRLLLLIISALLLTACSEEKKQFEQTVLQRMQTDKDIKDYHLDPETMTRCVVDLTSRHMPGFFAFDPRRKPYYVGYSKMLGLEHSKDPKALLQELQTIFGSGKGVADAHRNYSDSVMECIENLVTKTQKDAE